MGRLDDLLCSRNARPPKTLARANATSWEIACETSVGRAGEKYLPVGGLVRKSRAVEDQSATIPEEIASELGGIIYMDYGRPICAIKAGLATSFSYQPPSATG